MRWWHRASVQPAYARRRSSGIDGEPAKALEFPEWLQRLPRADIGSTIAFSKLRCVLSLTSMLLLASDVPRTGLGTRALGDYFPQRVAPGAAVFFGPYAYPVLHIECNLSDTMDCTGTKGAKTINTAQAWSYGFDTTSIGMRSAALLFNATKFPAFLLERGNDQRRGDPQALLSLRETFNMLDNLITSIRDRPAPDEHFRDQFFFERIGTQHKWVDRLHQHLLQPFIANLRWRVHSVNLFAKRTREKTEELNVCSRDSSYTPWWCGRWTRWTASNPVNASANAVSIWKHIDLRVQQLQQAHPDLWLDVAVFSTEQPFTTLSVTYTTYFYNAGFEIVIIVRGRQCSLNATDCRTIFVNDYRYERIIIETNVVEWYGVVAALRGSAQLYVWMRLLLLVFMCYHALPNSQPTRRERLRTAIATLFKIPFQAVVYGSLTPIVLYVFAFLIDGKFCDSYLDSYWSTVGGSNSTFHIVDFVRTASVQMRNVWVLALLAKLWAGLQTRGCWWRPTCGIIGIVGLAISLTSFLSIVGPYKSKSFRDTGITTAVFLGRPGPGQISRLQQVKSEPSRSFNSSTLDLGDSMAMTMFTLVMMLGLALVLYTASRMPRLEFLKSVFFRHSMVVPHTAGTIWSTTGLAICFRAFLAESENGRSKISCISPTSSEDDSVVSGGCGPLFAKTNRVNASETSSNSSNRLQSWQDELSERNTMTTSLVQLMNIAMMSDPRTFYRLRVAGMQLFVYCIHRKCHGGCSRGLDDEVFTAILPYRPSDMPMRSGLEATSYELVTAVNSKDLPLWVLLHCG